MRDTLRVSARAKALRIFRYRSRPRTLFQSASSILRRIRPVLRFRTENYDEYKQLKHKLELLLDKNDQDEANNLQLLLA